MDGKTRPGRVEKAERMSHNFQSSDTGPFLSFLVAERK